MKTEVVENFPEYMVFYAVYGESGYGEDGVDDVTDEDIKLYEEWRERNGYGTCFGTGSVYDESYFSSNPAFGLPCTVIPVVFEVEEGIQSSRRINSEKDNSDKLKEFERRLSKVLGNPNEEEDLIQYYAGRYDIPEETLDEIVDNVRIHSSRQIKSSQKGFENVVEGTKYDDYHIDTTGMGILDVEHIINEIEGRGNQAVLTVKTSDGATQHTQFNAKDWKAYKDAVNGVDEFSRNSGTKGAAITDVWVTEVEGGSYVRNSRRPIKSGKVQKAVRELEKYFEQDADGDNTIYTYKLSPEDEIYIANICDEYGVDFAVGTSHVTVYPLESSRRPIKSGKVQKAVRELEKYFEQDADGDNTIYTYKLSPEDEIYIANICDEYGVDFAVGTSHVTVYPLESSRRPVKSARYIATDPESGEVLGSADTYEEAVNEWGENVTITDSEATEGQEEENMGLFQSRRPIKSSNVRLDYDGMTGCYSSVLDDGQWFSYASSDMDDLSGWSYGTYDDGEIVRESWEGLTPEEVNESCSRFEDEVKNRVIDRNTVKTIIDDFYDKTGASNITSSKKPETTKQFVTRILSELETGEITEDEAAEEIAEANDVNIGYARQILSSYIADKDRYITSGMLELGDALNVEFDPDGNLDSWSVDFATDPEKPAPTLGGELVRAARYIISAFRDNDEKVGWGYAREVLNPAARFIVENTDYKQNDVFEDLLDGQTYNDDAYRQFIGMFETDFADYLRDHEELFHKLNKKSFEENTSESDEYSSVDEIIITDDEGNEYLFKYDGDNYVCYGIDEGYSPEYLEGDVLTPEDYPYDNIDFNEEFGEFEQDGFIYSWEDGDGESIRISDVTLTHPMFDYDDALSGEDVGNLIENGTEVYDINHNKLKISDIM